MLIASSNGFFTARRNSFSAKSYVQDGLIIQLDALENYAYGEFQELTDKWYDLVSGGYLSAGNGYKPLAWQDGYVRSAGQYGWNMSSNIIVPDDVTDYTVEYIALEHKWNGNATEKFPNDASCRLFFASNGFGNFYSFGTANSTSNNPITNGYKNTVSDYRDCKSFVVVNQGGHGRYIIDHKYDKQCETDAMGNAAGQTFALVGGYLYNFKFNAVRMYRRALTDSELDYNWSVDKARFNLPDAT